VLLPSIILAFLMPNVENRISVPTFAWKLVLGLLDGVGISMAIAVVPATAMTFVCRGGPWMSYYGIRVWGADGQRASRLRCLVRGLIVYSPALVTLACISSVLVVDLSQTAAHKAWGTSSAARYTIGHLIGTLFGLPSRSNIGSLLLPLTGALFIAGAVQSLARPERGLADRVARTYLVPR
jgi:hypothetical protein